MKKTFLKTAFLVCLLKLIGTNAYANQQEVPHEYLIKTIEMSSDKEIKRYQDLSHKSLYSAIDFQNPEYLILEDDLKSQKAFAFGPLLQSNFYYSFQNFLNEEVVLIHFKLGFKNKAFKMGLQGLQGNFLSNIELSSLTAVSNPSFKAIADAELVSVYNVGTEDMPIVEAKIRFKIKTESHAYTDQTDTFVFIRGDSGQIETSGINRQIMRLNLDTPDNT